MKKFIKSACVAAVVAVSGYNVYQSQFVMDAISNFALPNVEAIAGCEISSSHANNTGYCSSIMGGSGDSCVTTGSGSEPRCSGNY